MELFRRLSFAMALLTLVGCGGGDGGLSSEGNPDSGNNGSNSDTTLSISISTTDISSQNPATVSATLLTGSTPVSGQVVTFTTTLGVLSPQSGTALTNAEGIATITLTAGDSRGAGTVTAQVEEFNVTDTVSFTTQGDDSGSVGDISITLRLVDADGNETDTITAASPGRIIADVNGITSPVIVDFSTVDNIGQIPVAKAVTDDSNQASVDIFAGSEVGAGIVTVSIDADDIDASADILVIVGATDVRMGSGDPFVEGQAELSLAQISAGGTTAVSVHVVDDDGQPFNETIDVQFSSGCSSLSTPTATLSSPVPTLNGVATSIYLARGCVGDDTINVTANAGGVNLTAIATVNVLPADVGSIKFESATPENIAILGTGNDESSTVVFQVLDTNGNPVNNQLVNFSLNTETGGVELIPESATTDINGQVQTVVNSGTVATTVRVKAAIDGSSPEIATQSSLLVVSTGIPDQDSMSLSASSLNPEAWQFDGEELAGVQVNILMADAFNNPVPDGTAVNFTTEGGSIDPSCVTQNGGCSVTWRGQQPRPEGELLTSEVCYLDDFTNIPRSCANTVNTLGQKFGGRATILATAIGEESFPDLNGNGRFDASEMSSFVGGTDVSGEVFDVKEAFVDHNEDGVYNPGEPGGNNTNNSGAQEEFVDFNSDGSFTQNDRLYNGVLCSVPAHAGCSTDKQSVNVRSSLVLVMSGSDPYFSVASPNFGAAEPDGSREISIGVEAIASVGVIIADLHNQPMPAGTTITFNVTGDASLIGQSSFTMSSTNRNGGLAYGANIKAGEEPGGAQLDISIETPNGVGHVLPITINITP
ncbi:hypothetical protein DXX93_07225 [Thalassotalea euphylliae]|uniref:Big-1 domain-containing protein n=1 Tax=Thalassotalea euphylliae TaxID=1655234 RepID=A0A3E0TPB2_9GAMM|nr:hypothetical protein [Thalassotalea euphylliae]REL26389.1 hypothetical protein DXX93_07225 [Thalassotalea euphylliae]